MQNIYNIDQELLIGLALLLNEAFLQGLPAPLDSVEEAPPVVSLMVIITH